MDEERVELAVAEDEFEERDKDQIEADFPCALFSIADVVYGISSKYVLSIDILGEITPMVESPHYMRGITNFRGDMITVIDMRALFGQPPRVACETSDGFQEELRDMIVVIETDEYVRGIVVDEIVAVEYIQKTLEMPGNAAMSRFIERLAKRAKDDSTVIMLEVSAIR